MSSTDIVEQPKEEGVKVYAGNLSYKTTDEELKALFAPLGGEILSSEIVVRNGRSSGYGFVSYKDQADAEKAVADLNGKEIEGRALSVELARSAGQKERKPKAPKKAATTPAGRAPRAEDAVDGEEGAAAPVEGEQKPKKKRAPRRKTKKAPAAAEGEEGAAEGGEPAAPKAPRAPRAPKAAPAARIDDDGNELPAAAPRERKPRAPRAPREPPTGEPSPTLVFVANLPFTLDDAGLAALFTDAGVQVKSARIVKRKFGIRRSKGFGFVDTEGEGGQAKALEVDGKEIEGRAVAVKVALNSQAAEAEQQEGGEAAAAAPADGLAQTVESLTIN